MHLFYWWCSPHPVLRKQILVKLVEGSSNVYKFGLYDDKSSITCRLIGCCLYSWTNSSTSSDSRDRNLSDRMDSGMSAFFLILSSISFSITGSIWPSLTCCHTSWPIRAQQLVTYSIRSIYRVMIVKILNVLLHQKPGAPLVNLGPPFAVAVTISWVNLTDPKSQF